SSIDFTEYVISFDVLGGAFKTTSEITLSEQNTITYLRGFGDYQSQVGDVIPEGSVFTFDVSEQTEFVGNVVEVKPQDDLFAFIFDINALKYKRNTDGMLKEPFYKDRKSTRLNSSHVSISYAVFCLQKKS